MTLDTTLFPDVVKHLSKAVMKVPGNYNMAVPALIGGVAPKWGRATVRGCGGQGNNFGGGAAISRTTFPVTPGENLIVQVGTASQASVAGDSYVKRNDGTVLAYADRGRGSGAAGQASLSVGDIKRDGQAGGAGTVGATAYAGAGADDTADAGTILGPGLGFRTASFTGADDDPAGPGGGGRLGFITDGVDLYRMAYPASPGEVAIEFFDGNPS